MLLMVSVSVFVQNGMKNINQQKSNLDNNIKIKQFTKFLYENIDYIDKSFPIKEFSSGILFKVNKNYDKWWFAYIWETQINNFFCSAGSDFPQTKHIIIKNFVPFEWENWDIFNWKNFNSWSVSTNMFAWLVDSNSWILIWPTDIAFDLKIYISDTLWNSVYFTTPNDKTKYKKIVWNEIFWDEFEEWTNWTWIYLNNPTWLEVIDNKLLISDTLNDRILYLDLSDNKIYTFLWREDWLKEPTWLYYDSSNATLYISNSWKKEILAYSSTWAFQNSLNINFKAKNSFTANKVVFTFLNDSSGNIVITWPTNTWSFIFPSWQNVDFLTWSENKLSYYFADYINGPSLYNWCNWNWIFLSEIGDFPYKISNCNVVSHTWNIYKWNILNTFASWIDYNIKINNLTWSNLDTTWVYYVNLEFFKNWNKVYWDYFPYYVKWDNNLFTKDDNTLRVLTWSFIYPTWIYKEWGNIVFNDFFKRKKFKINSDLSISENWSLTDFNFPSLALNSKIDTILSSPIKSSEIKYENNMANIYFDYYRNFECYGELWQNITKEFILKK